MMSQKRKEKKKRTSKALPTMTMNWRDLMHFCWTNLTCSCQSSKIWDTIKQWCNKDKWLSTFSHPLHRRNSGLNHRTEDMILFLHFCNSYKFSTYDAISQPHRNGREKKEGQKSESRKPPYVIQLVMDLNMCTLVSFGLLTSSTVLIKREVG